MQRPLFSTPTSLTDLTAPANVDRAAAELNRAIDLEDQAALADWARRYGPQAIDALREADAELEKLNDRIVEIREMAA